MNELLRLPLSPALVLLAAAALLRIFSSPRRALTLAPLTLLPLAVSFVLLMALRAEGVVVWEFTWWPLVTPPLHLRWTLDGWNWLSVLLILLTGGGAVLLTGRSPGKRSGAHHGLSFALLAAAALTVVTDNLLTLSAAWVAADILLVARARGSSARGGTAPVWLEVAGSLLMLIAIGITDSRAATASLATAPLPAETMALLLVVAGLRMAAYPLHLRLAPSGQARDRGTQLLINCVVLITGGWLLGRVFTLGAGAWFANPLWLLILVLLTLLAGLTAWTAQERDRLSLLSSSRATWLWLILAMTPTASGRDALGWGLAGVVLGLILLAVGQTIDEQWRWRAPMVLAVVTLAGLPLTAGMPARALADPVNLALMALLVVADGLAVAVALAGWQAPRSRPPLVVLPAGLSLRQLLGRSETWDVMRLLTALGLALVPDLLWGIQPVRLAMQAGFSNVLTLGGMLGQLGLGGLLAIVAALALGVLFHRLAQQPEAWFGRWRPRLGRAVGLSWLLAGAAWLAGWIELGWRNALLIVEGEGYLGWVALALLIAILLYGV
ncbi:MAG TPA: hypothetical protein PKM78_11305 [Anaerolineae bacterium]|nr:hypothetical protein [Anaerolineae bacterium]